jgi:transcriptional regulator with XRE-family HTH domain
MIDLARLTGIPLGAVIKMMREEKGFSARSLSLTCGLSPSYVSKLESGVSKPTVDTLMKIATELELNESEILFLMGCQ